MKVANKNCRQFVETQRPFKGSNLYAEIVNGKYVVFSYGPHFPLYICVADRWYGNSDSCSVSTSRHRSQAMPSADITWLSTSEMRLLINKFI